MATFNFGIGLQIEGNGAAGIADFTKALAGLNATLSQISDTPLDLSGFIDGINEGGQEARDRLIDLLRGAAGAAGDAAGEAGEAAGEGINDAFDDVTRGAIDNMDDLRDAIREAIIEELGLSAEEVAENFDDLEDMVDDVIDSIDETGEAGKTASEKISAGFSGTVVDAIDLAVTAMSGLVAVTADVLEGITDLAMAGGASKIEEDLVRLSAQMGYTGDAGRRLRDDVDDLTRDLKISPEVISQVIQGVGQLGVSFDAIAPAAQRVALQMAGMFDVDPQAVAAAVTGAEIMGSSLDALAQSSAEIGAAAGVPGMIEQLPGAIDFARDAQAQFSTVVGKTSAQVTTDMQRMTAFYSKALGKSAPEAARLAQATFTRFTGAILNNRDVFLGLANDFDPMTVALLEAGKTYSEAQHIMQMPLSGKPGDHLAFIQRLQAMKHEMAPAVYERLIRRMQISGDEATAHLLSLDAEKLRSAEDVTAALDEQREAEASQDVGVIATREQTAAFQKMADTVRDSVGGSLKSLDAMMEGMQEELKAIFGPDLRDGIKWVGGFFGGVVGWIRTFRTENAEAIKTWGPLIGKIAAGAAIAGTALLGIGAVVGPIGAVVSAITFLGGVVGAVAGIVGPGVVIFAGLAAGFVLVATEGAKIAKFMTKLTGIMDSSADAGTKFGRIVGTVITESLFALDSLLGGKLREFFEIKDDFQKLGDDIGGSFEGIFEKVGKGIGKAIGWLTKNLPEMLETTWKNIKPLLEAAMPFMTSVLKLVGEAMVETLGGIAKGFIAEYFGPESSSILLVDVWMETLKLKFVQFADSVKKSIKDLMAPLLDLGDALADPTAYIAKKLFERMTGANLRALAEPAKSPEEIAAQARLNAANDAYKRRVQEEADAPSRRQAQEIEDARKNRIIEAKRINDARAEAEYAAKAEARYQGLPPGVAVEFQRAIDRMVETRLAAELEAPRRVYDYHARTGASITDYFSVDDEEAATTSQITEPPRPSITPEPPPAPTQQQEKNDNKRMPPANTPAAVEAATGAVPPANVPVPTTNQIPPGQRVKISLDFASATDRLSRVLQEEISNGRIRANIEALGGAGYA